MACTIQTNQSGVVNVLAENGNKSLLYKSILKLPFIESEEDALTYYEAALTSKAENILSDINNEPILMYASLSDLNTLALPNKAVYTSSYSEALAQDKDNRGVEVGFVQLKNPTELNDLQDNEFFTKIRNESLRSKNQVVGRKQDGTILITDSSINNFKPLVKVNKLAQENSLSSFINELVTGNFIQPEKVPINKLQEETTIDFKVFDMGNGNISVLAVEGNEKVGTLRLKQIVVNNTEIDNLLETETPILNTNVLKTNGLPDLEIIPSKEVFEALEANIGGINGFADPQLRYITIQDYDVEKNTRSNQIANQITENGYIEPLIVSFDKNGAYIVEGQHRAGALQSLGYDKAPVRVIYDKSQYSNTIIQVDNVQVKEQYRGQGIGTELYFTAFEELGQEIYSDNAQTEAAMGLWESLVTQGFAEKLSDNKYKLTSVSESNVGKSPQQLVSELIRSGEISANCKL